MASLVTEDTLFYHMNKFLVDKEKQDILELNEMQYGPPMTEEYALNKAIETLKMTRKKNRTGASGDYLTTQRSKSCPTSKRERYSNVKAEEENGNM